jgi:hypothetical protein
MFQTKMLNIYSNHWALKICDNTINMGKCLVSVRSMAQVCSRLIAGNASLNSAESMDIRLFCLLCVVQVAASVTRWSPV